MYWVYAKRPDDIKLIYSLRLHILSVCKFCPRFEVYKIRSFRYWNTLVLHMYWSDVYTQYSMSLSRCPYLNTCHIDFNLALQICSVWCVYGYLMAQYLSGCLQHLRWTISVSRYYCDFNENMESVDTFLNCVKCFVCMCASFGPSNILNINHVYMSMHVRVCTVHTHECIMGSVIIWMGCYSMKHIICVTMP